MARLPPIPARGVALLLALALLGLGATLPLAQTPPTATLLGVRADTVNGTAGLRADLALSAGSRPANLTAMLIPLTRIVHVDRVAFYFDPAYPVLGNVANIYGVLDHLRPALLDRGFRGTVDIVDAAGLARILESNETPVVVMVTGVFPDLVLSNRTNLVTPWLSRGGILVWTGDLIGAYIGLPGETTIAVSESQNLNWTGEQLIFGSSVIVSRRAAPGNATTPTNISTWLGLEYPLAEVGARVSRVEARGGLILGYIYNGYDPPTSIAWVPVGLGGVVLFGYGPVLPYGYSSEAVVAQDTAQILMSGILGWNASLAPDVRNVSLAAGQRWTLSLAVGLSSPTASAALYVYGGDPLPTTGYPQVLSLA